MITNEEQTTCGTLEGLFETLLSKFKPQFNETIKSLQFWRLCRKMGKCRRVDGEAVTHSSRMQLPRT